VEIDVAKLKADWAGREFDAKEFEISQEAALEFARACGETDPRFTDPAHPHFRAPDTFTAGFTGGRIFPEELQPLLRRGFPFDAGKRVEPLAPIRPGDRLIGRSEIHDVYEKTGRSGSMLFLVHRMTFTNQDGRPVSIVDWRMVVRNPKEA
jgi:hypothetical protein